MFCLFLNCIWNLGWIRSRMAELEGPPEVARKGRVAVAMTTREVNEYEWRVSWRKVHSAHA